jgi:Ankyrin repeats (many copies)
VTKAEMERALVSPWNKSDSAVAAFLLDRGVDVNAQADGFTAVNMAATMGQAEAVRFLIARGAALEIRTPYDGTSLGGALWGGLNTSDNGDYVVVTGALLAARARIEPGMAEWWENKAWSAPAYAGLLELLENHAHRP